MQHALERLGPGSFQDLAAAIVIAECGAQVKALGAGRDGGRDLEYRGELPWRRRSDPADQVPRSWTGHTVFQVKHKATVAADHHDNAAWVKKQIRAELEDWGNPRTSRGAVPNQLVFITNVPLTPVPKSGGLAQVENSISSYMAELFDQGRDPERFRKDLYRRDRQEELNRRRVRMRNLQDWDIWDGNQVDALVTVHDKVRQAIPGLLTVGDVLLAFAPGANEIKLEELKPARREQGLASLMSDRYIYFDEAGGSGDSVTLERAAIDLPLTGTPRRALDYLLNRGDRVLRQTLRLDSAVPPPHVVLTGIPGNGKTTLSKLLVQAYRASFLANATELSIARI